MWKTLMLIREKEKGVNINTVPKAALISNRDNIHQTFVHCHKT